LHSRPFRPAGEWLVLALFNSFVTEEILRYGYVAIFLLMVLESACVPIPSEVTMLFGGALATAGFAGAGRELDPLLVGLVGAVGNLAGSWLAYWVGYAGGRRLAVRWGRYLLIRPHEIDRAHDWFEGHGEAAVFFGRLLPVVRTFISLPAGIARMNPWRFTFYTLLGCLPWVFGLTWLGYVLGRRWDEVERVIRPFAWAVAIGLAVAIGGWVWRRWRGVRTETPTGSEGGPDAEAEPETAVRR
jgi:membrane protein DedA with SNARE-associated domain